MDLKNVSEFEKSLLIWKRVHGFEKMFTNLKSSQVEKNHQPGKRFANFKKVPDFEKKIMILEKQKKKGKKKKEKEKKNEKNRKKNSSWINQGKTAHRRTGGIF